MFSRKKNAVTARPVGDDVIISAQQVIKTYDTGSNTVQALKGVDFEVRRGEMVGVMGPSG